MSCVESVAQDDPNWVLQPLVEVGLPQEQIRGLVFRLAFDAVVSEGRGGVAAVTDVVRDEPAEVRAAWAKMIGRMLHDPAD